VRKYVVQAVTRSQYAYSTEYLYLYSIRLYAIIGPDEAVRHADEDGGSKIQAEQIQFGRVVIPNLTLPGNPGSNLILVTEIEIQFVFLDESRKLPRIQLRGNIFLWQLSVASFAIDHPSRGQTFQASKKSKNKALGWFICTRCALLI
jgi:hypothetical protein